MATPRLTTATPRSRRLTESPSRGIDDSPTLRVGELATSQFADFSFKHSKADFPLGNNFSIANISANSKPKSERLER
jgi:hypothetical protein